MADTRDSDHIFWVEPRKRAILPLDKFHISRSLIRTLKRGHYILTHDLVFEAVVRNCAAPAEGRRESWINQTILDGYLQLHKDGHAHSIETWSTGGELVGGLYGVRIGAAFFGESMFSRSTDASKVALAHLAARLQTGNFQLLDTQFLTPYLESFGGTEIHRGEYLELLKSAVHSKANWNSLAQFHELKQNDDDYSASWEAPPDARLDVAPVVTFAPEFLADRGPSGDLIVQLLSQTS